MLNRCKNLNKKDLKHFTSLGVYLFAIKDSIRKYDKAIKA